MLAIEESRNDLKDSLDYKYHFLINNHKKNDFLLLLLNDSFLQELSGSLWSYSNEVFIIIKKTIKYRLKEEASFQALLCQENYSELLHVIFNAVKTRPELKEHINFIENLNECFLLLRFFLNFKIELKRLVKTENYQDFIVSHREIYQQKAEKLKSLLLATDYKQLKTKIEDKKHTKIKSSLLTDNINKLPPTDKNTIFYEPDFAYRLVYPSWGKKMLKYIKNNPRKLIAAAIVGAVVACPSIFFLWPFVAAAVGLFIGLTCANSLFFTLATGLIHYAINKEERELTKRQEKLFIGQSIKPASPWRIKETITDSPISEQSAMEIKKQEENINSSVINFLILINYGVPENILRLLTLKEKLANLRSYLMLKPEYNAHELVKNFFKDKENLSKKIDFQLVSDACLNLALFPFNINRHINIQELEIKFSSMKIALILQIMSGSKINIDTIKLDGSINTIKAINIRQVVFSYFTLLQKKEFESANQLKVLVESLSPTHNKRLNLKIDHSLDQIRNIINRLKNIQEKINSLSANKLLPLFFDTLSKSDVADLQTIYKELRQLRAVKPQQANLVLELMSNFFEHKHPKIYKKLQTTYPKFSSPIHAKRSTKTPCDHPESYNKQMILDK